MATKLYMSRQRERELVLAAQAGDRNAEDQLVNEYKPYIEILAMRYAGQSRHMSYEQEDWAAVGLATFPRAIKAYDPSRGVLFRTYWRIAAMSAMRDVVVRRKKRCGNHYAKATCQIVKEPAAACVPDEIDPYEVLNIAAGYFSPEVRGPLLQLFDPHRKCGQYRRGKLDTRIESSSALAYNPGFRKRAYSAMLQIVPYITERLDMRPIRLTKEMLGSINEVNDYAEVSETRKPAAQKAASGRESEGVYFVGCDVPSLANLRAWQARNKATQAHRLAVSRTLGKHLRELADYAEHYHAGGVLEVTIQRFGIKRLDTANLYAALKYIEDAVALMLGADDGSPTWKLTCDQATSKLSGARITLRKG